MVKLTTICPGNCKCCKNRLIEFDKIEKKYFDIDDFRKVCAAIKNVGGNYIALSGGEPTLVFNIKEFIEVAHSNQLSTRINTSGFNITEENLNEWLDSGLDQVVLSVYGIDADTYIKNRGNALMYKRCLDALKTIKKLKEKRSFIFILQTVIMKDNYTQMNDLLNLAIDSHADKFWPSYLEDAHNLPDVRLDKNDISNFRNKILPLMTQTLIDNRLDINGNLDSLRSIYNEEFNDYVYHSGCFICPHIGKHLSFYPDGRVDPCCGFEYTSNPLMYIDYRDIDNILTIDFMKSLESLSFDFCKYCPQGLHREVNLNEIFFNEYDNKECLNEKRLSKSKTKF